MPKPELTEEEIALFRAAVRDVQPLVLKNNKVVMAPPSKSLRQRSTLTKAMAVSKITEVSDYLRETVTAEQALFFARSDLPIKLLQDLKKGKIKQAVILDLHGYTVATARTALATQLATCMLQGVRCLRIIHGKGKLQNTEFPILKNQVNNWLQQHQCVLAFCSAQPRDGGVGAVYVLLKNSQKLKLID